MRTLTRDSSPAPSPGMTAAHLAGWSASAPASSRRAPAAEPEGPGGSPWPAGAGVPEGGLRDTGGPRAVTQGTCRAPRHWQEVLIDSLVRVTLSRRALVRVGGTL